MAAPGEQVANSTEHQQMANATGLLQLSGRSPTDPDPQVDEKPASDAPSSAGSEEPPAAGDPSPAGSEPVVEEATQDQAKTPEENKAAVHDNTVKDSNYTDDYNPPVSGTRLNVCKQMAMVGDRNIELKDALKGLHLHFATKIGPGIAHFVHKRLDADGKPEYYGYDIEVLKELSKRAGFNYTVVETTDNASSFLRDEVPKYDVGITHKVLSKRMEVEHILPVHDFVDASYVLVTSHANAKTKPVSMAASYGASFDVILSPYDTNVWLSFLAMFILTAIVYLYLEYPDEPRGGVDVDKESLSGAMYHLFQQLATVGTVTPSTHGGKLLAVSWSLTVIVFVAAYTAELVAGMADSQQEEWKSVSDVMHNGGKICVLRGNAFWQSTFPVYKDVVYVDGETIPHMKKGLCDAALTWQTYFDVAQRSQVLNPGCKMHVIGKPLSSSWAGWQIYEDYDRENGTCTELIRDVMHIKFLEMAEDGTMKKLYDTQLVQAEALGGKLQKCPASQTGIDLTDLPFETFQGLFMLHTCVIALAFCAHLAFGDRSAATPPKMQTETGPRNVATPGAPQTEADPPKAETAASASQD
jgi:hypothetical protein